MWKPRTASNAPEGSGPSLTSETLSRNLPLSDGEIISPSGSEVKKPPWERVQSSQPGDGFPYASFPVIFTFLGDAYAAPPSVGNRTGTLQS